MKITVDYDEATGQITDNGLFIANIGAGLAFSESAKAKSSTVQDLTKLKDAGFTAQDIMQMKREGLI